MQARRSYQRAIRFFERSRNHKKGTVEEVAQATTDEIISFFIEAYHIKDYVKKEMPTSLKADVPAARLAAEAEAMFHPKNGRPAFPMAMCHDICNASKHGELRRNYKDVTQIYGIVMGFPQDYDLPRQFEIIQRSETVGVTCYVTGSGLHFADDVMADVLKTWQAFFGRFYRREQAELTQSDLLGIGPKPPVMKAVEDKMREDFARGDWYVRRQPLLKEIPADDKAKVNYWIKLPPLEIPETADTSQTGLVCKVEAFEMLTARPVICEEMGLGPRKYLPAARISERDSLMRFRLPLEMEEIVMNIVALSQAFRNPFPCRVEFGKLQGRKDFGGYYVHLL